MRAGDTVRERETGREEKMGEWKWANKESGREIESRFS